QAQAEVEARSRALPGQDVPLAEAGGRVLARPVAAARDLPGTDISMMDGYALRASDAAGALRVVYEVAAGDAPPEPALQARQAARGRPDHRRRGRGPRPGAGARQGGGDEVARAGADRGRGGSGAGVAGDRK